MLPRAFQPWLRNLRLKNSWRVTPRPSVSPCTLSVRWHSGAAASATSNDDKSGASATSSKELRRRIFKTLSDHVWSKENSPEIAQRKRRVVASLGLMAAGKALNIQVPYIFKELIDSLPASQDVALAAVADPAAVATSGVPVALLLGYGMARASATGFQEWRNAVFAHVAQDTIRNVGTDVFQHVHKLDMQFHLSRNTGQVSRVLDRGQRSISFVLNSMVFHLVPTLLEVSLVTGLMAYNFGWAHSGVVLATVVGYTSFTIGVTQWRTKFRREMNRLENQASGRVVDSLLNYETVKFFNNEEHEVERYDQSLKGYQNAALEAQQSLSLLNFGQSIIFALGLSGVMWLTAAQVLEGTATVGDLVLVNGLLFQLSIPLFFFGSVYATVRQSLIDMENMFQLRDTEPHVVNHPDAVAFDPARMGTSIEFRKVQFSYPTSASERHILQGLDLTIPEGKTVAIVGSSGCGKSTILRLLYRFYDQEAGSILIGGKDARHEVTIESLQESMAVVPQDTVLFHESIGYNIQYGNLDASWDEVTEASKKAQIHDTIMSFPDGYDTVVGERGMKLSGGEKQRVAIARAMLKDSPILLCDEPTSSLDSKTETEIMSSLKDLGKSRTTLIIAHRLSTIQDCDLIVVLHEGKVVEQGSHGELIALGGRYTELLRMQESSLNDR